MKQSLLLKWKGEWSVDKRVRGNNGVMCERADITQERSCNNSSNVFLPELHKSAASARMQDFKSLIIDLAFKLRDMDYWFCGDLESMDAWW